MQTNGKKFESNNSNKNNNNLNIKNEDEHATTSFSKNLYKKEKELVFNGVVSAQIIKNFLLKNLQIFN